MAPEPIEITPEMGEAIRARRDELELTVEEAVARAGRTPKTAAWRNVESGGRRFDQKTLKGVCRALSWIYPDAVDELRNGETPVALPGRIPPATPAGHGGTEGWSEFLEQKYDEAIALGREAKQTAELVMAEIQAIRSELAQRRDVSQ